MKIQDFKGRIIVTSGKNYIDIDAYASCIVYANILSSLHINAIALTTAKLNESVPKTLFGEKNEMLKEYSYKPEDKFIVLDVSNENFFDTFVKSKDIIQIIDHHYGYEEHWNKKLGEDSIIQPIGSVATVIEEFAEKTGYIDKMSESEAYLLMAAILDNTLNFDSKTTTDRDRISYEKLSNIVKDNQFNKKYFNECQNTIQKDLAYYVKLATKCEKINEKLPETFSQLVVWDKNEIFSKLEVIASELDKIGIDWILNLIVLEEKKSYIISKNENSKKKIEKIFTLKFDKNILDLGMVWLRKEIIKKSFEE